MWNGQNRLKQAWMLLGNRPHLGTAFEDLQEPAPLLADFFDSSWYALNYPDVAQSGVEPWIHYLDIGAREGRRPGPKLPARHGGQIVVPATKPRDRLAFLRLHLDKSKKVLEIGPAFNPIAPKSEGYRVYTVDNASKAELRARYDGFPDFNVAKIEDVDFIWKDADILSAIPREHLQSFDVVLMGGVIEHIPNPIGLLQSLQKLLKPGGYLTLSVPDKRFCFDFLRPPTTTAAWLEALKGGHALHSARTLFEANTMAAAHRGRLAWAEKKLRTRDATFVGATIQDAYRDFFGAAQAAYVDAHAWVFTPSSFLLILNECHALGLISLVPESISARIGSDFFVHLRLAFRRPINHHERLQLMANSAREQAAGFCRIRPARAAPLCGLFNRGLGFFARGSDLRDG